MNGKNIALITLSFFALTALVFAAVPSGTITAPADYSKNTTANFAITAQDANWMKVSCTAASDPTDLITSPYAFDITSGDCNSSDGLKTVYLRLKSEDLNFFEASNTIILDKTVPTITVHTPTAGAATTNWVSFDVNDNIGTDHPAIITKVDLVQSSGTTCTAFGTSFHCDGNLAAINKTGSYTITIDANDLAGNPASTASISVNYSDNAAPAQVSGLSAAAGSAQVSLSWTANSETDLNNYNIYQGGYSGFDTNSQTLVAKVAAGTATHSVSSGISNGTTYYFKVSASDKSGNEGTDSSEANATPADNSAPTDCSINAPEYSKTATPTLTLSGCSSGTAEMRFSCNNSSWSSVASFALTYSSFDITSTTYGCISSNGVRTIYAQFKKSLGVWSSSATDSTTFDNNAPSITISTPADGSTINSTTASLNCSGTDSNSGIFKYYARIDSENWIDLGSDCENVPFTGLTNAQHTIYVKATDYADNNSSDTGYSTSFTVSVTGNNNLPDNSTEDSTNPSVNFADRNDNSTVSGIVTLKVTALDNKRIKKIIFYQGSKIIGDVNSKTGDYYIVDWNTRGLAEGKYVLTATAYDSSNNSASDMLTVNVLKEEAAIAQEAEKIIQLREALNQAESKAEEIIGQVKALNLSLSNSLIAKKTQMLNEIDNAKKFALDKNYARMQQAISNANKAFEEFRAGLNISIEKETQSTFESSKIKELIGNSGINFTQENLEKTATLTKNSGIERTIQIIKVKDSNSEYYKATVLLEFSNKTNARKKFKIVEVIPKSFAENASLLKSSVAFTVLKDDPIIAFEMELDSNQSAEIVYSLDKKFADKNSALALASAQNVKAFEIPPIAFEGTGNLILASQALESGNLILILAVVIIVALLALAVFLSKRNSGGNFGEKKTFLPSIGLPKLKSKDSEGLDSSRKFRKKEKNEKKPGSLKSQKYNNGIDVWD